MMRRTFFYSTILVVAASLPAAAQAGPDAVFARARQLVLNGNGAAGRVLVDSVVAASTPDTPAYAEALYWRATLAAESADAERDYRRIIVEYPLSRRSNEALLQLGQLEAARGDRAAATAHLERFLLENPQNADRARIGLQVVRLAFDLNDAQGGCTALGRVLKDVPADAVETRNQLAYFSPRCVGVDTTGVPAAPGATSAAADIPATTTPPTKTPPTKTPPTRTTDRETAAAHGIATRAVQFTLQLGAFPSRAEADRFAKKLKTRGYETRVMSAGKLFRVRFGRYATRAEAAAEAKRLKAKKIDAYITETGSDDR